MFIIFTVSASQDGSIKMFDLLEARPIYDVLGHKSSVTSVKFSTKGDYFASGSEDKMVYVWKTNFDEVDEQVWILKTLFFYFFRPGTYYIFFKKRLKPYRNTYLHTNFN